MRKLKLNLSIKKKNKYLTLSADVHIKGQSTNQVTKTKKHWTFEKRDLNMRITEVFRESEVLVFDREVRKEDDKECDEGREI